MKSWHICKLRSQKKKRCGLSWKESEIFRKYGVTLTAIILAARVTIGVVIDSITKALKATGKSLGNGLKNIGSKLSSTLPGQFDSIVSFLFKTSGQVVGYLSKHTWL